MHRSAWNSDKAKFAFWGFSEVRTHGVLGNSINAFKHKHRSFGVCVSPLRGVGCLCSFASQEEGHMETIIDTSILEDFRAGLRGAAYAPSEEGYDEARRAWNLNAHQRPALVVMAVGAADVIAAVRLARDEGLGVGVMATGHGVASPCDGGVLINTSRMRGVHVDPEAQTSRVEPGALWADVIPEAQVFGLAGLVGSSSVVGVVGYTMGGGFGWLGRKYGYNADSLREADVVTADGELRRVSAYEHPDLFWGLKGGGGNFGIVTSMEFALYPLTSVYGGNLFYSLEQTAEVLDLYSRWVDTLPDEMTTAI